jgi:hypothetical protein
LTTVIGLKYQNGILLFSDTQESVPTSTGYSRSLFQGKLYPIRNNRCVVGCAGRSADIDKFVSYISLEFKDEQNTFPYEDNELYIKLNKSVLDFCGELKEESKIVYDIPNRISFDFQGLFAAPIKISQAEWQNQRFGLYQIDIYFDPRKNSLESNFSIRRRNFYACIGSGSDATNTLLRLIEMIINEQESKFEIEPKFYKLNRKFCAMICDVLIGLIAQLDVETALHKSSTGISEEGRLHSDLFSLKGRQRLKGDNCPSYVRRRYIG